MLDAQRQRDLAAQAQAEADAQYYEAQRQAQNATAQAAQATANAQSTRTAHDFMIASTADALAMLQSQDEATRVAQAAISQATSEAQATTFAEMQKRDAYNAAQQERELERIKQENITKRSELKAWAYTIVGSILILGFLASLAYTVVKGADLLFRARAFSYLAKETRSGPMTLARMTGGQLEYAPQLLVAPTPVIDGDFEPATTELDELNRVIPIHGRNGIEHAPIIMKGTATREGEIEKVKFMLRTGIEWQDENNGVRDRLPSWKSLSEIDSFWNSTRWQKYKALLQNAGVVTSKPGSATRTRRAWGYENLQDILDGIEDNTVVLSPTLESVS
jgi:hypothetical protein